MLSNYAKIEEYLQQLLRGILDLAIQRPHIGSVDLFLKVIHLKKLQTILGYQSTICLERLLHKMVLVLVMEQGSGAVVVLVRALVMELGTVDRFQIDEEKRKRSSRGQRWIRWYLTLVDLRH